MQSAGTKLTLINLCGAHLQAGAQNWIGQGDFGNLLHQISDFLNKNFFKFKKKWWKSCVWLLPWAAYPQKVGWIDMNDIILRPITFAGTKTYFHLGVC